MALCEDIQAVQVQIVQREVTCFSPSSAVRNEVKNI